MVKCETVENAFDFKTHRIFFVDNVVVLEVEFLAIQNSVLPKQFESWGCKINIVTLVDPNFAPELPNSRDLPT